VKMFSPRLSSKVSSEGHLRATATSQLFPDKQTRGPGGIECVFRARDTPSVPCPKPETAVIAAVPAPIGHEHHESLPSFETFDLQRFGMAVGTYKTAQRRTGRIFWDHSYLHLVAFALRKRSAGSGRNFSRSRKSLSKIRGYLAVGRYRQYKC
jgi:hypothetical protein